MSCLVGTFTSKICLKTFPFSYFASRNIKDWVKILSSETFQSNMHFHFIFSFDFFLQIFNIKRSFWTPPVWIPSFPQWASWIISCMNGVALIAKIVVWRLSNITFWYLKSQNIHWLLFNQSVFWFFARSTPFFGNF